MKCFILSKPNKEFESNFEVELDLLSLDIPALQTYEGFEYCKENFTENEEGRHSSRIPVVGGTLLILNSYRFLLKFEKSKKNSIKIHSYCGRKDSEFTIKEIKKPYRFVNSPLLQLLLNKGDQSSNQNSFSEKKYSSYKIGFTFLDHDQRMCFVMASDPVAKKLPLIGVWIAAKGGKCPDELILSFLEDFYRTRSFPLKMSLETQNKFLMVSFERNSLRVFEVACMSYKTSLIPKSITISRKGRASLNFDLRDIQKVIVNEDDNYDDAEEIEIMKQAKDFRKDVLSTPKSKIQGSKHFQWYNLYELDLGMLSPLAQKLIWSQEEQLNFLKRQVIELQNALLSKGSSVGMSFVNNQQLSSDMNSPRGTRNQEFISSQMTSGYKIKPAFVHAATNTTHKDLGQALRNLEMELEQKKIIFTETGNEKIINFESDQDADIENPFKLENNPEDIQHIIYSQENDEDNLENDYAKVEDKSENKNSDNNDGIIYMENELNEVNNEIIVDIKESLKKFNEANFISNNENEMEVPINFQEKLGKEYLTQISNKSIENNTDTLSKSAKKELLGKKDERDSNSSKNQEIDEEQILNLKESNKKVYSDDEDDFPKISLTLKKSNSSDSSSDDEEIKALEYKYLKMKNING